MKTVEFCHDFDPLAGDITIKRTGGAFPSRLTIIGAGAKELAKQYHNSMSGWDAYPSMISSDVVEICRSRNTSWDSALPLLKNIAERAGFEFKEVRANRTIK